MPLTTSLRAILNATQTGANDFGGPTFAPMIDKLIPLTSGVAANQADIIWADERTLAASATENLDLAGALTDAFGATVTAVKLKAVLVIAADANTNDVLVGGAASNAVPIFGDVTDIAKAKPGGFVYLAAPGLAGLCTVTASTGDILKIANSSSGTSVTYKIAIVAASA